ncbi:MAG: response regulator [Proteobacteria bacterium]|nr:response regulator [Pseudomonadota bacterium]
MIKTVLIDDHVLVRSALREMLQEVKGVSVIGDAGTAREGIELVQKLNPDFVILDLKLPDQTGLEVTQKILRYNPDIKILIVSSVINDLFLFRLLEAGAHGYITKEAKQEELIQAIKSISAGQRVISPQLAKRLALAKTDYKKDQVFTNISDREMEVLMMVVRGMSVKEMAEKLKISHKTVHSYRSRIFEKLNVKSDLAVTLLAIHHGLIVLEE